MEDSVRVTLERLERQLLERVTKLQGELLPLEKELDDVRRARAALQPIAHERKPIPNQLTKISGDPKKLTMKELALKALSEHFHGGATAVEMLDFFKAAWGRNDIVRESLSPQLSRLKSENKIYLSGKTWRILHDEKAPAEKSSGGAS